MKRLISFVLLFTIMISCIPLSVSAQRDTSSEQVLAQELKDLGLFRGVSETDFALNRAPSRVEAIVMLIRILGKETEALNNTWNHPFTDVPTWANNYVGYAYSTGLTKGTSATEFGTGDASAAMFLTFVLRALGYSDAGGADFTWDNPFALSESIGILNENVNIANFWRADVVLVSHASLCAFIKGTTQTLAQKLIDANVFSQGTFDNTYNKTTFPGTAVELTAEEIFVKCSPAVFYIEIYDENVEIMASGSGFFIDDQGTAVTNYHVIEDAYSALIQISDTKEIFEVEGVYDYNKEQDWAVIKINCTGNKYLNISDAIVNGGAKVYAIGSPLGLQNTISEGIISNPARETDTVTYIQTSAAISHGSSGGALINTYGEVIGITSAGLEDGQNLNLAIPVNYFKDFKKDTLVSLYSLFFSPTIRKQGAIELLKKFILKNYQSINEALVYEYSEKITNSNGYTLHTLFYDSTDNQWTVRIYQDRGSFAKTYFFNIHPLSYEIFAMYAWENFDTGNSDTGIGSFYCKDINPNYQYQFIEYDGEYLETDEQFALSMHIEGLEFINSILFNHSSGTNCYSTHDLGYTTYQASNISYTTSEHEVVLDVNETKTISLDYITFGFPSTFYVYVATEDKSIATANWDDSTDKSLPWKIEIHGIAQGTTYLKISNEYNNQFTTVKITVHPINATIPSHNSIIPSTVSFPLYLYSNDGKTYLGKCSTDKYDKDSISNTYGDYGSKYSSTSIFNKYGTYGSNYSSESAFSKYASKPPQIVDSNGRFVAYLTENKAKLYGITYTELIVFLTKHNQ